MTSHIPRRTAEAVVRVLAQNGFALVSQRGSHQKWRSGGLTRVGRQVIVPYHQGRDLPAGTIKSIIEGSGLPFEVFAR